jgi:hypothetical protein
MRRSSAPTALLLCALLSGLVGCAAARRPPEGQAAAALRPGLAHAGAAGALQAAAADPDPALRGIALSALIRVETAPAGGALGPRAAWDPSPWVQRQLVEALAARATEPESGALLTDLATRPGVEPYVACAAALRAPAGPALTARLSAQLERGPRWARPPCALAGLRHGLSGADAAGNAALAEGDLPLNLGFLADLSAEDARALSPGLEAALPLIEPELLPPLAALLVAWGAPAGRAAAAGLLAEGVVTDQLGLADALAGHRGAEAEAGLREVAAGGAPAAREAARLHLAARGAGPAAPVLEAAADAEDRERRARALLALGGALCGASPDKRLARAAPELLRAGLRDEDDRVQIAALQAISVCGAGGLKAAELEPLLVDAEAEGRVRVEAARALLVLAAARS